MPCSATTWWAAAGRARASRTRKLPVRTGRRITGQTVTRTGRPGLRQGVAGPDAVGCGRTAVCERPRPRCQSHQPVLADQAALGGDLPASWSPSPWCTGCWGSPLPLAALLAASWRWRRRATSSRRCGCARRPEIGERSLVAVLALDVAVPDRRCCSSPAVPPTRSASSTWCTSPWRRWCCAAAGPGRWSACRWSARARCSLGLRVVARAAPIPRTTPSTCTCTWRGCGWPSRWPPRFIVYFVTRVRRALAGARGRAAGRTAAWRPATRSWPRWPRWPRARPTSWPRRWGPSRWSPASWSGRAAAAAAEAREDVAPHPRRGRSLPADPGPHGRRRGRARGRGLLPNDRARSCWRAAVEGAARRACAVAADRRPGGDRDRARRDPGPGAARGWCKTPRTRRAEAREVLVRGAVGDRRAAHRGRGSRQRAWRPRCWPARASPSSPPSRRARAWAWGCSSPARIAERLGGGLEIASAAGQGTRGAARARRRAATVAHGAAPSAHVVSEAAHEPRQPAAGRGRRGPAASGWRARCASAGYEVPHRRRLRRGAGGRPRRSAGAGGRRSEAAGRLGAGAGARAARARARPPASWC